MVWLHEMGYTFLNMGRLTYTEIDVLADGFERKMKRQVKAQKKAAARRRR